MKIDIAKGRYWDENWSVVAGCTPVGAGCENCWAQGILKRFGYPKGGHLVAGVLRYQNAILIYPENLDIPYWREKPTVYSVGWLGDLFHEGVPDSFIDDILLQIWFCKQHTFLLLTKRIERAVKFLRENRRYSLLFEGNYTCSSLEKTENKFPFANLWLGFSASTQAEFDEGIKHLEQVPAVNKWVSLEPLLEDIDLYNVFYRNQHRLARFEPLIDWLVVGAESGSGKRKCKMSWIENIVLQASGKIPIFVKQAQVDGKLVKMPKINGKFYNEIPFVKGE